MLVILTAIVVWILFGHFITIAPGYVGVIDTGDNVEPNELLPGMHLLWLPSEAQVITYATTFKEIGLSVAASSRENTSVVINITVFYNLSGNKASDLQKDYGSFKKADEYLIKKAVKTALKEVVKNMSLEDCFRGYPLEAPIETATEANVKNTTTLRTYGLNVMLIVLRDVKKTEDPNVRVHLANQANMNRPTGDFLFFFSICPRF